jgi:hypothetical protein
MRRNARWLFRPTALISSGALKEMNLGTGKLSYYFLTAEFTGLRGVRWNNG